MPKDPEHLFFKRRDGAELSVFAFGFQYKLWLGSWILNPFISCVHECPWSTRWNSGRVEERTVSDELKETAGLRAAHRRPVNSAHAGAHEMKETY